MKIYCIDVDMGSATLIVSPTNRYLLIDAGDDRSSYGDTVLALLDNLGITHLDYTIATHYHEDHIGGFPGVIYGLSGTGSNDSILYYCFDRGDSSTSITFRNYRNAIGNKRINITLGCTLDLDGNTRLICVAKNGKVMNGDSVVPGVGENYRSIALLLEYGYFKLFIGGDLIGFDNIQERDVESKVAPVVRKVDVLVVNHHGSMYASNDTFLDSLRPKVCVISQGVNPVNYGFPHQQALDRLVARNIYIYQINSNPTGGTFPPENGRILNATAVITVDSAFYTVDGDTYTLPGQSIDESVSFRSIIQKFEILPNPAKDYFVIFNLPLNNNPSELKIYNSTGKLMKAIGLLKSETRIMPKDLKPGVYFIQVNSQTQKLIIHQGKN